MKRSITRDKQKRVLKTLVAAVFWIAVWYAAAAIISKEVLVASPQRVAARLFALAGEGEFWLSVGLSLLRILVGFAAGVVIGCMLGFASFFSSYINTLFSPVIAIIRATPVASFIILALVWISKDGVPSFITMLMVMPIVFGNCMTGLSQTDIKLLEMAKVFGVSKLNIFAKIYLPSVYPYLFAAVKTVLGLGWKAGIAAEVLCTPRNSIGKELYEAKIYLETADVFAWTAVIVVLSFIIEKLLVFFVSKLLSHRKKSTGKAGGGSVGNGE